MGGPQIFNIGGSFSGAHFVSLEIFPLLSCLRKRNAHEAATSLCSAFVPLQKRRLLWVDDLGKDATSE